MADQASFGEQTQTTEATPAQPNLEDMLKGILNEQGEPKYKTLEDAIRALDHSQKYIPELKSQLSGYTSKVSELEAKVAQFGNIEDTVQRLLAQRTEVEPVTPASNGLDEQAVMRLVQQSLEQRTAAEVAEANFKLVNKSLVDKYGEKTEQVVAAKARELGTTPEALVEMSKTSPAVVQALFQTPVHNGPSHTSGSRLTPDPVAVVGEAKKPEGKSLLIGITDKERGAYLSDLRKEVYGKMGIDV